MIGRNEGERLRASLASVVPQVETTVYVDSGSTDGSQVLATQLEAETVELDTETPFTAARARNAGLKHLLEKMEGAEYVQFVDGDCELEEGWITLAANALSSDPRVAIVVGRLAEMAPHKNIYHRLAAMEWDAPLGIVQNCGGIAFVRVSALRQIGGFDEKIIAAEDDELCIRLRLNGWTIIRVSPQMAKHDMRMEKFSQWWRRAKRAGHGFAQVYSLHGGPPLYYFRREFYRTVVWGGILPVTALLLAFPTYGLSIVVAAVLYGVSLIRTYLGRRQRGDVNRDAMLYAIFATISKFSSMLGVIAFFKRRYLGQPMTLIEHKSPAINV